MFYKATSLETSASRRHAYWGMHFATLYLVILSIWFTYVYIQGGVGVEWYLLFMTYELTGISLALLREVRSRERAIEAGTLICPKCGGCVWDTSAAYSTGSPDSKAVTVICRNGCVSGFGASWETAVAALVDNVRYMRKEK